MSHTATPHLQPVVVTTAPSTVIPLPQADSATLAPYTVRIPLLDVTPPTPQEDDTPAVLSSTATSVPPVNTIAPEPGDSGTPGSDAVMPIPQEESSLTASSVTLPAPDVDDKLYVMDAAALNQLSVGAQIAFQSLQGIVNQDYPPQIFINVNDGERHYDRWLDLLAEEYGVSYVLQDDFYWYFSKFQPHLRGYILFDSRKPASANVALSLAGLLDAIAVDTHDKWLLEALDDAGLPQLLDVRDRDSDWLRQSEYWQQLNKEEIVQLHPLAGLPNVRDFGVARWMAFFYNDTPRDPDFQLMRSMIADLNPGARMYGWGYTDQTYREDGFVGTATVSNLVTVPSDQAANLSVFMHHPLRSLPARNDPSLPVETDAHYVTFIMSDGDNVQVMLNKFAHPTHDLYASPQRGQVPIGWTLPPSLAEVAPPVMEWLYRQATPNDDFLAGPSGWGYVYPSISPNRARLASKTQLLMNRANLRSLVVLDYNKDGVGFNNATLDLFTAQPNVDGLFFVAYDWADPHDLVLWSNGKPVFSTLRLGYARPAKDELDALAEVINNRPKDATSSLGYTVVYAHFWATTVSDLVALAERLGPGVEVVRPDVFIRLATQNISP